MPRTVKPDDQVIKRNQILDAAEGLIYSKGYERVTIQDMIGALKISNGAFFHYFPSKAAVLEALIERTQTAIEQSLLPLIHEPHLNALEKLQQFFDTFEQAGITHQSFTADLLGVWFADDNAIVREKVYEAMMQRRAPLLKLIVEQGIQEGVFNTPYPEQVGEVLLSLARGMSTSAARLILSFQSTSDAEVTLKALVTTYDAYVDALERILGAQTGILRRADAHAMRQLVLALKPST